MSGGQNSRALRRSIEKQHGKGAATAMIAIQVANQTKRELDALTSLLVAKGVIPPPDVRTPGGIAVAQPGQSARLLK